MKNLHNILILAIFTALSIGAAFVLPSIMADYEFIPQLPAGSPDRQADDHYLGYFPEEPVLILAMDAGERSPELAAEVFALLSDLPGTRMLGPKLLLETPAEERLRPVSADSPTGSEGETGGHRVATTSEIEALLARDAFAASLFKAGTGPARLLYLYKTAEENDEALLARVQARLPAELAEQLRYWGLPYYRAVQKERSQADTVYLIPAAALVCLLMQLLITRRLMTALSLWSVSLVPALWATALYPLSGTTFKIESILVPVQIIALSTSYAIQYYRYASVHGPAPTQGSAQMAIKGIRPIILLSGSTTMLGFLSLLAIPIPALRTMAVFIVMGIAISMATALVLLPILLGRSLSPERSIARLGPDPISLVSRPIIPLALVVLVSAAAAGLPRMSSGALVNSYFRPWDEYSKAAAFMDASFGGMNEFELILDGGSEFFFISPDNYENLKQLSASLQGLPWVSSVLDPSGFIDWSFRRINSLDRAPQTMEELGETVELASGSLPGLSMRALLAADSRIARILIRGSVSDPRLYTALNQEILELAEKAFPGGTAHLTGALVRQQAYEAYLVRGLIRGLAWFLPTLFAFLLLYFRAFLPPLLALIPPASALLVYFGLAGWFDVRVNSVVAVGAAVVMGVGVDDVLHLLLTVRSAAKAGYSTKEACKIAITTSGRSIIQTTAVIIACLGVLGFSGYSAVAQVGLLAGVSLATATLLTLSLVPYLMAHKWFAQAGTRV